MAPLFIVFEGIDGSGKSTQSRLLHEYLLSRNIPCLRMMEPTGGTWGKKIRKILKGDDVSTADELNSLFIADRRDDADRNIIPALENNMSVVMDRYYYSNAAYQGAMGIPPEDIIRDNRNMNFPEPHRVYFMDISPETALRRISLRNKSMDGEIFEKKDFLHKVREIYLSFIGGNFISLDGSGHVDEVFQKIKNDIDNLI